MFNYTSSTVWWSYSSLDIKCTQVICSLKNSFMQLFSNFEKIILKLDRHDEEDIMTILLIY
jgi:hypothetical protein